MPVNVLVTTQWSIMIQPKLTMPIGMRSMDTDYLEPPKPKHVVLPRLEEIFIEDLENCITELESAVSRASDIVRSKETARGTADSVFKS